MFKELIERIKKLTFTGRPFFNIHLNEEESIVAVVLDDSFFIKTDIFNKEINRTVTYTYENGETEIVVIEVENGKQKMTTKKCSQKDFYNEVDKILKRAEKKQ